MRAEALGTLSVSSFGALGVATQDAGGTLLSTLSGSLKKLTVKGDGADLLLDAANNDFRLVEVRT